MNEHTHNSFQCDSSFIKSLPPANHCAEGQNVTVPFTKRIALVRLLGGFKRKGKIASEEDIAQRNNSTGKIVYHWDLLHQRLSPSLKVLI